MSRSGGTARVHLATATFVLVFLAGACGGGGASAPPPRAEAGPQRGGTLVIGSTVDADAWNEYVSQQTFAQNLLRRVYARLAQEQGDTSEHPPSFEPLLAASWAFSEGGLTLTFKLNEATWSDGTPLTDTKGRRSYVTSAGAGPSLGKYILMAYLPPEHAVEGSDSAGTGMVSIPVVSRSTTSARWSGGTAM